MTQWAQEDIQRVVKRLASGETAAQVSRDFGVSRNAIIGINFRYGDKDTRRTRAQVNRDSAILNRIAHRNSAESSSPRTDLWTDDEIELARSLCERGRTLDEITAELPGRSRQSVYRKLRRLGKNATALSQRRVARKKRDPLTDQPEPKNIVLEALERRHCRFPVSDSPKYLFCGHDNVEGSSYCGFHDDLTKSRGTDDQ